MEVRAQFAVAIGGGGGKGQGGGAGTHPGEQEKAGMEGGGREDEDPGPSCESVPDLALNDIDI